MKTPKIAQLSRRFSGQAAEILTIVLPRQRHSHESLNVSYAPQSVFIVSIWVVWRLYGVLSWYNSAPGPRSGRQVCIHGVLCGPRFRNFRGRDRMKGDRSSYRAACFRCESRLDMKEGWQTMFRFTAKSNIQTSTGHSLSRSFGAVGQGCARRNGLRRSKSGERGQRFTLHHVATTPNTCEINMFSTPIPKSRKTGHILGVQITVWGFARANISRFHR